MASLAWIVTPAYSTTLTAYSDLASFNAASNGDQTIDFTGKANGGAVQDYSNSTGVAYPDVQLIGITPNGYALDVSNTTTMFWYSSALGRRCFNL